MKAGENREPGEKKLKKIFDSGSVSSPFGETVYLTTKWGGWTKFLQILMTTVLRLGNSGICAHLPHSRYQFDFVLPGVLQTYLLTDRPHFFWGYYLLTYVTWEG